MESHTHYTFLMGMRRQAGSREWPRLFGNEDLRLNPNCKPNARDSIVHLVKPDAAVANSFTTNPTSCKLNLGIVTGGVDPLGFGSGRSQVRVRVEIFHPANDPYPDTRSCRFSTYLNSQKSVGGD